MSCTCRRNVTKTNKPLTTEYFLLIYYLRTYLLKSNPDNPVPKPVHTSSFVSYVIAAHAD